MQEVIDEADAWKRGYYDSGRVDEFTYSVGITGAFLNRNGLTLAGLQPPESFPFLAPSDDAVPFVDNHDSQRGRIGRGLFLTYKRAAPYALANVFMLAYPYGYPRLMSSYVFSDTEVGPPSDEEGQHHARLRVHRRDDRAELRPRARAVGVRAPLAGDRGDGRVPELHARPRRGDRLVVQPR